MDRAAELYHITNSIRKDMNATLDALQGSFSKRKLEMDKIGSLISSLNIHWDAYKDARNEHDEMPGSPTDCR